MGNRRGEAHRRYQQEKEEVNLLLPYTIDVNADIGEGAGTSRLAEDSAILDLVSSANIACGFHAGDETSMRETVRAAHARGVAIGAHPSYPDLTGFGRRELGLDPREIRRHVASQIQALQQICVQEGARLTHVKPHGALYNRAARDSAAARAAIAGMVDIDGALILLGLAGSEMQHAASKAGVAFASEAFADRAYRKDARLVPRDQPGAIIENATDAVTRALRLVSEKTVRTIDGMDIHIAADSLCVHGDNPHALDLLRALKRGLDSAGVRITSFAT